MNQRVRKIYLDVQLSLSSMGKGSPISVSKLQREFRTGYNEGKWIIEELVKNGFLKEDKRERYTLYEIK